MPTPGEQVGGGGGPYPGSNPGRSESESRAVDIFRRPTSPQSPPANQRELIRSVLEAMRSSPGFRVVPRRGRCPGRRLHWGG